MAVGSTKTVPEVRGRTPSRDLFGSRSTLGVTSPTPSNNSRGGGRGGPGRPRSPRPKGPGGSRRGTPVGHESLLLEELVHVLCPKVPTETKPKDSSILT